MKNKNLLLIFGLILPMVLVFKAFFMSGELAWGDAPYLHTEAMKELVAEPLAWSQNDLNFGGVHNLIFLSPILILYGLLNYLFGFDSGLIVRLIFYLPAVILSGVTSVLFARNLKLNTKAQLITGSLYIFNTYFLLLVDGGQVGVILAYSMFPLSLLLLKKLDDKATLNNYYLAIISLALLMAIDPRIAIISLATFLVWIFADAILTRRFILLKRIKSLLIVLVWTIGLSAYWIIPIVKSSGGSLSTSVTSLNLTSLLNSLTLFQPHWPGNQFGEIVNVPFYFLGIPLLIFFSIFTKKPGKKVLIFGFVFLTMAFLVKGTNYPLGSSYEILVNKVPFGSALRDSNKFFIPAILFAGVLIGECVSTTKNRFIFWGAYLYILFLVYPAILGNLNFVLSGKPHSTEISKVNQSIMEDNSFYRSAWFPEREPIAFKSQNHPALDAKYLADLRPIARMNVGSSDKFNFMHNQQYIDWFRLMGIKKLILSGDPRKTTLNEDQQEDWNNLHKLIDSQSALIKRSDVEYQIEDTLPEMFAVNKLFAVVGGDNIYDDLYKNTEGFSVTNNAFTFFEDGNLDPHTLEGIASESAVLVFNQKSEDDLRFSFLQDYFYSSGKASLSEWANYAKDDYLLWKYQLLIRDIDTSEFDYGKGISLSTNQGESIKFDVNLQEPGEYVLGLRGMNGGVDCYIDGTSYNLDFKPGNIFGWNIVNTSLSKGKHEILLKNNGDITVFNALAIVPKVQWDKAGVLVNNFVGHFKVVKDIDELKNLVSETHWEKINTEKFGTLKYDFKQPAGYYWVIFTNTYNTNWKLLKALQYKNPTAVYSAFNGYYVDPSWGRVRLEYVGQNYFRWGAYISVLTTLTLASFYFWKKS